MEKIDKKKLETSILYIERMTAGHNPVNNTPVEDSLIQNENVVRCLYFIKDVLEKIYKNEGYIGRIPRKKANENKQPFPLESLEGFVYSRDKTMSEFLEQLNCVIDNERFRKLTNSAIYKWLIHEGYLCKEMNGKGRKTIVPTNKGKEIGISTTSKPSLNGYYLEHTMYGKAAQEFIVENMSKILSTMD